jgi:hypothetical protein
MGFNPTLVRLRPDEAQDVVDGRVGFQSHAGSIEARARWEEALEEAFLSSPRWFD